LKQVMKAVGVKATVSIRTNMVGEKEFVKEFFLLNMKSGTFAKLTSGVGTNVREEISQISTGEERNYHWAVDGMWVEVSILKRREGKKGTAFLTGLTS